jgi:hypothetical protein
VKWPSIEDIIIWGSVITILLLILWMTGCASQQKVYEATYVDGCYFHVAKASSEEAQLMQQKWDFDGCKVTEEAEDEQ